MLPTKPVKPYNTICASIYSWVSSPLLQTRKIQAKLYDITHTQPQRGHSLSLLTQTLKCTNIFGINMDITKQKEECEAIAKELLSTYFDNGTICEQALPDFMKKCQALMSSYPEYSSMNAATGNYIFNKIKFDQPLVIQNPSISKLRSFFTSSNKARFTDFNDLKNTYIIAIQQKIDEKLSQSISAYAFHMLFLEKITISSADMKGISDVAAYMAFKYRQGLLGEFTKERW